MSIRGFVIGVAAASVLSGCGSSNPAGAPTVPVTGHVMSAPSCPVARAEQPCLPRAVPGAVVLALVGSRQLASTTTDTEGAFRLTLAAGHYTLRAQNSSGYRSAVTEDVEVSTRPVELTLVVDSGIR